MNSHVTLISRTFWFFVNRGVHNSSHFTVGQMHICRIKEFNIHRCVHRYYILRIQPTRFDASQFIYFCKTLHMFQTIFLSIIRSSKLHIQRQAFVRPYCYLLLAWPGWSVLYWMTVWCAGAYAPAHLTDTTPYLHSSFFWPSFYMS
jgi:hypothetical protein